VSDVLRKKAKLEGKLQSGGPPDARYEGKVLLASINSREKRVIEVRKRKFRGSSSMDKLLFGGWGGSIDDPLPILREKKKNKKKNKRGRKRVFLGVIRQRGDEKPPPQLATGKTGMRNGPINWAITPTKGWTRKK